MTSNCAKYQTRNPIARRLIRRFLDRVVAHARLLAPARVVDLGCGEGLVAQELLRALPELEYRGIERDVDALRVARAIAPGREFIRSDFLQSEPDRGWADVSICLEVLEHLQEPDLGVRRIAEWSSRAALISVPWEPFFRIGSLLRGNYLTRFGDHPEHLQHFGPVSLYRLVKPHFERLRIDPIFPWLIAIAEGPRRS